MKKFLPVMLTLILFFAASTAEAKPVRIARLPIIFKSTVPDFDTRAELEMKLARAVHVPLNKTLQLVEYLPTEKSKQALSDIWQRIYSENKKAKFAEAMRPLAQKLDSDIVVCPILLSYNQYVDNLSGFDDIYMTSTARVELIVYDRRTDNLTDKKVSQMYHDSYHPRGTASALAKECLDRVIDDTKLRHLVIAIK